MEINKETALKIWIGRFGNVEWAKDRAGAWINREHYGITKNLACWEVITFNSIQRCSDNFSILGLCNGKYRSKADNYPSWNHL
jgi:hypothetical protein